MYNNNLESLFIDGKSDRFLVPYIICNHCGHMGHMGHMGRLWNIWATMKYNFDSNHSYNNHTLP
jgi:hypothetical protein